MKEFKDIKGASEELNIAAKKLIGIELKHIETFSDVKLIELMMLEKDAASVKMYVTGILLKEKASLLSSKEMPREIEDINQKSLSLLLESYLGDKRPINTDHAELINGLLKHFNAKIIPDHICEKIVLYHECNGNFAKAEDMLFELIERNPSYIREGILFYERLLEKTDSELENGNLPRNEVEESILLLNAKLNAGNV